MAHTLSVISFAHRSMDKWYAFSTDEIKTLNQTAIAKEYNRAIDDETIALLKDDSQILMRCVIPDHTNFAGKFSIRAMLVCMIGDEKETMCLDISHKDWKNMCAKRMFVKNV